MIDHIKGKEFEPKAHIPTPDHSHWGYKKNKLRVRTRS